MPWLSLKRRGPSRDEGVVALLVAFFFGAGVFVTLLALVVDIGTARVERRELQNGAEAAVVSAAYDCSLDGTGTHVCGNRAPLITLASRNARDGSETVTATNLCGLGNAKLSTCTTPRSQAACPDVPTASQWAQVTTSTWNSGGNPYLPQFFARYIPGFGNKTITACAQASWGAPGSLDLSTPFAIGQACWQQQLASHAGVMPSSPPYSGFNTGVAPEPWSGYELALVFGNNSTGPTGSCRLSTVSSGGFGWLDASTDLCALSLEYGQSSADTGKSQSSSACSDRMFAHLNATLSGNTTTPAYFNRISYVPIYDTMTGTSGTNASYHVAGFAAFYMTAFQAPALNKKLDSRRAINSPSYKDCDPSLACVYGWFVNSTIIAPNAVPAGAGQQTYGFNVVSPIG